MVEIEKNSGNKDSKIKNDERKNDKDNIKNIGDQYSVIKNRITKGKGISWELLDQFNFTIKRDTESPV